MIFHDRTTYDEQVVYAFTEFVELAGELAKLHESLISKEGIFKHLVSNLSLET